MAFTLKQYLDNPLGKGVGSIAGDQSSIKKNYLDQMLAIRDKIQAKWYSIREKTYVCHIKLPSSSEDSKVVYDVVFEFDVSSLEGKTSINELPLTLYSNCPSFVFTYANVFWKQSLICQWAKSKYNQAVFRNPPSSKNSLNLIGYEKSIYISGLYLMQDGQNMLSGIKSIAILQQNYSEILRNIQHQDEVMSAIDSEKKSGKEIGKIDTKKVINTKRKEASKDVAHSTRDIPIVKAIKSIKNIGKSKKTKKTKRI